jgi:hypothetical protein
MEQSFSSWPPRFCALKTLAFLILWEVESEFCHYQKIPIFAAHLKDSRNVINNDLYRLVINQIGFRFLLSSVG